MQATTAIGIARESSKENVNKLRTAARRMIGAGVCVGCAAGGMRCEGGVGGLVGRNGDGDGRERCTLAWRR